MLVVESESAIVKYNSADKNWPCLYPSLTPFSAIACLTFDALEIVACSRQLSSLAIVRRRYGWRTEDGRGILIERLLFLDGSPSMMPLDLKVGGTVIEVLPEVTRRQTGNEVDHAC